MAKGKPKGHNHVWVLDDQRPGLMHPGLLLEWRRTPDKWEGMVAYLLIEDDGSYNLIQGWLPSEGLRPL